MPLVTATILVYAAGLLAGFGGALIWPAAAAALVVWHGARTRRDRLALAVIAIAGGVTATVARKAESSCGERLVHAKAWEVMLGADASPGAFVPAQHACGIRLRIAVAAGRAAAGAH